MNNQTQQLIKPITCPKCGNKELAFITEYHKCIWMRIINTILAPFIALFVALTAFKVLTFDAAKYIASMTGPVPTNFTPNAWFHSGALTPCIIAVLMIIAFIVLQIFIFIKESKTHACAICSACGNIWNLN